MEQGYGEVDSILQSLKDLPIIPLADGRLVALNGEGVFFPMEENKTKKKKSVAQTGNYITSVYCETIYSTETIYCKNILLYSIIIIYSPPEARI